MRIEQFKQSDIAPSVNDVTHGTCWQEPCSFTYPLDPTSTLPAIDDFAESGCLAFLPYFAQTDPLICQISVALTSELESGCPSSRPYIDALTAALTAHLIRHYSPKPTEGGVSGCGLSNHQLKQVLGYINTHLDQNITLASLASSVGMSQYYFCRLFKQSMGITPYQYVLQQRVERAKHLLKQHQFSIADVALQCGFANQSHLNRHFKRIVGVTPLVFLKQD